MVRCGLVGCGRVVEDLHMPALGAIPGLTVAAICDTSPARLDAFGARHGIERRHRDIDSFLARNDDLDFVLVATPGYTHHELAGRVIDRGLNVVIEKPLALNLADALDLARRAEAANVKACVVQNYRFRDPALGARAAIDAGHVGDVYQVTTVFHGQSLFNEPSPWAWQEKANRVLLYELAIHFIDLHVYLGGPVKDVIGVTVVDEPALGSTKAVYALVRHEGTDAVGILDIQLFASSNFVNVEVYGTANDVTMKFFPDFYRVYSGYVNPLDEVADSVRRVRDVALPLVRDQMRRPAVKRRARSHYRLLEQFVRSLRDPAVRVPVSIDDVLPTMGLLERLSEAVYP